MPLYSPAPSSRLCAVLRPAGGYFCAYVQQGSGDVKTQNRRKGYLQARHGVLCPCGYPYIPAPQNSPQKPPEARAGHKATPARSVRSKPGYYHLFRAMDSTAQRSLSASHQAQREPRQDTQFSISTAPADAHPAIMIGQSLSAGLFAIAVSFIVAASKKSFHSSLTSRKFLK